MPDEQEFLDSLKEESAPEGYSTALQALWWDMKENWSRAHELVASDDGPEAAWVHAYLHRKEGDRTNAGYWYAIAEKPEPGRLSLDDEAAGIRKTLLHEARITTSRK